MDARYGEVVEALGIYFDGLYHSDTERLGRVFHPLAVYVTATEAAANGGRPVHLTMGDYFPIVDARPSPAGRGEARRDRIVSIEFAGPITAFARVECAIAPKVFTDFLTLIKTEDRWQIIAKVFHFDLEEGD
ncbi:nuclear transport factor 2 family protein [Pelagibius sp. 7325]|uniref:nuclear transport factor 2 family protein n=1 Tax=Pelagibius sp. 7325 TaxID=3131994 RepID=UPI0030EB9FB8